MRLSTEKKLFFSGIIILGSLLLGTALAETALRMRSRYIERSDRLDPGLVMYDQRLGWRLSPAWTGRHRHHDFDVQYSINRYGFRGDFPPGNMEDARFCAVVGDSFTFAFGVNDRESFVEILNSRSPEGNRYLNFGVPGYSTDQECLLIEERVFDFSPRRILLVVFLFNDILDNELPFPLQGNRGKPRFEMLNHNLTLRNVPVPLTTKALDQSRMDLNKLIMQEKSDQDRSGLMSALERLELFRMARRVAHVKSSRSVALEGRFDHALRLFHAIVGRIQEGCARKGVDFTLVLMPGRSYVEDPGSVSALFQDYIRKEILARTGSGPVSVIDLSALLRERYRVQPGKWFYPHEGHLTPAGHHTVAQFLSARLSTEAAERQEKARAGPRIR